jgi:hypothetical protein
LMRYTVISRRKCQKTPVKLLMPILVSALRMAMRTSRKGNLAPRVNLCRREKIFEQGSRAVDSESEGCCSVVKTSSTSS